MDNMNTKKIYTPNLSAITLKPYTGEVYNIDYVITVRPVSGGIYKAAFEQSVLEFDVLEDGKMGESVCVRNHSIPYVKSMSLLVFRPTLF